MTTPANHPIKSLEKTVAIIDVLKRRRSAHLREVADELELNKSTVHNHLATLREHEYVVKEGEEYRLSLQFLHIGGVLRNEVDSYDAAKKPLDQLAEDTGALVTLATHERGLGIVLYRAKGDDAVEIDTHAGTQLTLHNSGLGKAILAHLPRVRVEEIIDERGLPASTENSITDEETLYEELDAVEEQGYAFDDEENWRGLRCVAAPILTDEGTVQGAISLSVPKSQLATEAERQAYVDDIKNAANLIELRIAYS